MPVTDVRQALGEWSLNLLPGTPKEILNMLLANPFGHIAIIPGDVTADQISDYGVFTAARFMGVFRKKADADEGFTISGSNLNFWLGDEDGKGPVISTLTFLGDSPFNVVTGILAATSPNIGVLGQVSSYGGSSDTNRLFAGTFSYQTVRDCLTYLADYLTQNESSYGTTSWRARLVNTPSTGVTQFLIDLGPDSLLNSANAAAPTVMVSRAAAGRDLALTGLTGDLATERDWADYTTRVILLAEGIGTGNQTATGSASFTSPYKDLQGNAVTITRPVDESDTNTGNATVRANLQLNRFRNPNRSLSLSSNDYDVRGDVQVNDLIYVYDPDLGLVDTTQEIWWQGEAINPAVYRVTELTWPIESGFTVLFRTSDGTGTWYDLTPFYVPESGATDIVVGDQTQTVTADSNARTDELSRVNQNPRFYVGQVSITPTAVNTPTSAVVTFPQLGGSVFRGVATAATTVPGTTVTGVGLTGPSATGATIWVTRANNTTATTIYYVVYGSDS